MTFKLNKFDTTQDIASCCLFLSAKVEEQPRKLEHILKSNHRIVNKFLQVKTTLDMNSEVFN